MTKETRNKIIKAVITCIIAILGALGLYSCTAVMTTSKKGGGTQSVTITNSTTMSADSASINVKKK